MDGYRQILVILLISLIIPINVSESISDAFPKVSELRPRSISLSNNDNVNNNDNHESDVVSGQPVLFTRQYEQLMLRALINIQSKDCRYDLNATIKGIQMQQPWAIAMYDASVKVPIGIEYGAVYQFGNFDQCVENRALLKNQENNNIRIKPMYCLADVTINGITVRSEGFRHFMMHNTTTIHWGICVPASCPSTDIEHFLSSITGHQNVNVSRDNCHIYEPIKLNRLDIAYGCIIASFVSMALICTCYHIYYFYGKSDSCKTRSRSTIEQLIFSFSIIENLHKLGKGSNDNLGLGAINGIKAISMVFILAGHVILFTVGGPVFNTDYFPQQAKLIQNAFWLNSPLLVDTFLLIGGFLFARLLFINLDTQNGKVNFGLLYLFRYIRLTPAYFIVIGLYATWLPKLGSGPLWDSRMTLEQNRCLSSWWLNILYINNYVGTDKLCMFQSWYLSADTQLFILAPLIMYPLWRWRRFGLGLLGIATSLSIFLPFIMTYTDDLDPTLLIYDNELSDISKNYYFLNAYIKTNMRATSYIVGVFAGFLVYYIQEKNIRISQSTLWIGWITSIVIGCSSMFTIKLFYDDPLSRIEKSLYAGFHRFGWSLAISWVIVLSVLGYAAPIKRLLSCRILATISRLTYCAYLMNGIVELYLSSSIRSPSYMSTASLMENALFHIPITFFGALVLCLVFESPIHGIEKILLRREKTDGQDQ